MVDARAGTARCRASTSAFFISAILNSFVHQARCNGSVDRDDGDKEGVTSDDDDEDDDDDNASNISGFSGLSGDEWKPTAGPMAWIQRQALLGILKQIAWYTDFSE